MNEITWPGREIGHLLQYVPIICRLFFLLFASIFGFKSGRRLIIALKARLNDEVRTKLIIGLVPQ